jgi:hypothetical protein
VLPFETATNKPDVLVIDDHVALNGSVAVDHVIPSVEYAALSVNPLPVITNRPFPYVALEHVKPDGRYAADQLLVPVIEYDSKLVLS